MGFFSRFFGGGNSEEKFAKKHIQRITNPYTQKELREESLHVLAQRGTPEAIHGLLQRFTFSHPESIVDEKEKNLVLMLLKHLGAAACAEALRKYLRDQSQVSMALIALDRLEGPEATQAEVVALLKAADPGDAWSADRKLQLINHLDNYEKIEALETLFPYLEDVSDDVIFRCIDILEKTGKDEAIREPLVTLLSKEDTSMRIRARIVDLVIEHKWFLGDLRKILEPLLPEGYFFDKRGYLKRADSSATA